MKKNSLTEIKDYWHQIAQNKVPDSPEDFEIKLNFYKKMLSVLSVGDFYYFTFLPGSHAIEYVSPNIVNVIGYKPEAFDIELMLNIIHPNDQQNFIEFEKKVVYFKTNLPLDKVMKYKSQYNYRIRKNNGQYIPILQQSITIATDDRGAALRNFIIHTDISSLNPDSKMSLSFIGLEGEPSFKNVMGGKPKLPAPLFTPRERTILSLIYQNKSATEIATELSISSLTVKTHFKNIHKKSQTRSLLELYIKGKEEGWF